MLSGIEDRYPLAFVRWSCLLAGLGAALAGLELAAHGWQMTEPGLLHLKTFDALPALGRPGVVALAGLMWVAAVLLTTMRAPWLGAGVASAVAVAAMVVEQQLYSNHLVLLAAVNGLLLLALLGRRADTVPAWPVLLVRLQLSTVYVWTAIAKANPDYLSGRPIQWGTRSELTSIIPLKGFVVVSVLLLLVELALGFALWWHRTRPWALVVGVGLHLALGLGGIGIIELLGFALTSLSAYPLFLADPGELGASPAERAREVVRTVAGALPTRRRAAA